MTDAPERIENLAIRMAVGNNGGTWDTHYTEKQKDYWRSEARAVMSDLTGWRPPPSPPEGEE